MSLSERMAQALAQIASYTSIVRSRRQDVARDKRNGDSIEHELEAFVVRLERLALDLRRTIT